jgi:hypothetical protein
VRVLFDQGTPVPLRRLLGNHQVETAFERRWHTLTNGELLAAAERYGFDILMTTDKKLRYQQSSSGRSIAIIVLSSTSWPRIEKLSRRLLTQSKPQRREVFRKSKFLDSSGST